MKKQILIISIIIFIIFVGLSGCQESEAEKKLEKLGYANTEYSQKFGFNPPDGWTKDENDLYGIVRFYGPVVDDFNVNLGLSEPGTIGTGETFESLIQEVEKNFPSVFTDFSMISSVSTTVNGIQAHEIIYTYTQGIYSLQNKQVLINKNGVVYIITYAASQSAFDDYELIVEQSVNTFTVV